MRKKPFVIEWWHECIYAKSIFHGHHNAAFFQKQLEEQRLVRPLDSRTWKTRVANEAIWVLFYEWAKTAYPTTAEKFTKIGFLSHLRGYTGAPSVWIRAAGNVRCRAVELPPAHKLTIPKETGVDCLLSAVYDDQVH